MFGKVEAAAFAVSSPTSALWADSEKPIDTDAPSSKREEAYERTLWQIEISIDCTFAVLLENELLARCRSGSILDS
jgi:hypothetical protein